MNIKFIEGLQKRKNREESGCFFLEGYRSVTEAVRSGAVVRNLVVSESFLRSDLWKQTEKLYSAAYQKDAALVLLTVGDKSFGKIAGTVTPQGIGAVIEMPWTGFERIGDVLNAASSERSGVLLLENLQDPGNLGTVIRTADAAGFRAVLCSEGTVDIYNSKVLRSTVGSLFRFPILSMDMSGPDMALALKQNGYTVMAAHPRGGTRLFDAVFFGDVAVCVGNEAGGLSERMLAACDQTVTIPMPGGTESLNASVAAALMMYEVVRKNGVK